MKDGAHHSPFPVLSFPDSTKVLFTAELTERVFQLSHGELTQEIIYQLRSEKKCELVTVLHCRHTELSQLVLVGPVIILCLLYQPECLVTE